MSYETGVDAAPPRGPFDVGDAAFQTFKHAGRAGAGGLLGLAAIVLVAQMLLTVLMVWSFWPVFQAGLEMDGPPEPQVFVRMALVYGLCMLGQLILYSAADAALLRWLYGRGAPRLGLGADTWRLVAVGLCWFILSILVFAPGPVLLVAGAEMESVVLGLAGGLLLLAAFGAWIFLALRLAPAAALTIHRGRVRFASAWKVSAAAAWPLTGAYVIVWAIYLGASIVVQGVTSPMMMFVMFGADSPMSPPQGGPPAEPDPQAILEFFTSPGMLAVFAALSAVSFAVNFLFQAMLAGANAYAVRHAEGGA